MSRVAQWKCEIDRAVLTEKFDIKKTNKFAVKININNEQRQMSKRNPKIVSAFWTIEDRKRYLYFVSCN